MSADLTRFIQVLFIPVFVNLNLIQLKEVPIIDLTLIERFMEITYWKLHVSVLSGSSGFLPQLFKGK